MVTVQGIRCAVVGMNPLTRQKYRDPGTAPSGAGAAQPTTIIGKNFLLLAGCRGRRAAGRRYPGQVNSPTGGWRSAKGYPGLSAVFTPAREVVFRMWPSRQRKRLLQTRTTRRRRRSHDPYMRTPRSSYQKQSRGRITHRAVFTIPFFCERRPEASYLPVHRSEEPFIPKP